MSELPELPGPEDDAAPDVITVTCPHCDWTFTGAAKGRNSAPWRKGTHLRNKHGEAGKGKAPRRPANAPSEEQLAERPVLGVVRDMAAHVGGSGAPSEAQLAKALGRGTAIVTTAGAVAFVESDPSIPPTPEGEALKDRLVDDLAVPQKTGEDIWRPIARMLAPTGLNRRYGRKIVDNIDVLGSLAELIAIGNNWRRAFQARAAGGFGVVYGLTVPLVAPGAAAVAPPGAVIAPNGQVTTPPPAMGRLVTAEDVQRMRGAAG